MGLCITAAQRRRENHEIKEKISPESYSPDKPEIAGMMKESMGKIETNSVYKV